MDNDDIDITHLLGNVNLDDALNTIPDEQLITIINDIRVIERRPPITSLPAGLQTLNSNQRFELIKRITKEIRLHNDLKTNEEEEGHICLNKTELNLVLINRSRVTNNQPPVEFLPYDQIDSDDLPLYYPLRTDTLDSVFITDSDCRLIYSATYVAAGQCWLAPHSLHQVYDPFIEVRPFEVTQVVSSTPTRRPIASSGSSSSSSATTLNTSTEETEWQRNYLRVVYKYSRKRKFTMSDPGDGGTDPQQMIEQLKNEKRELLRKLNEKGKTETAVPTAKSEREEITAIKGTLNTLIKKLELDFKISPNSSLLDNSTMAQIKTSDIAMNAIYKLKMPENIAPLEFVREPETLTILKPSVISNTIGAFEPDINPKVDFRGIWERILEHTKNAQIYEHEYLSILRMVMKGTAASALDKISREFEGNLQSILEAIQDLYIPQMTFFDEYDELNNFVRFRNEHIRTTVRRASLAVFALKDTVAQGAWQDRRYTLLMQIIKQVIDRKTFNHLRMEELKCAHTGTQLTIDAVIQIVSLYETTNNLIPANDVKLSYNVNSMQLANQPDKHSTELDDVKNQIQKLTSSVKSLTPKKPRYETRQATAQAGGRDIVKAKRRLDRPQNPQPMQVDPQRGVKRPIENSSNPKPNYPIVPYQPVHRNNNPQGYANKTNNQVMANKPNRYNTSYNPNQVQRQPPKQYVAYQNNRGRSMYQNYGNNQRGYNNYRRGTNSYRGAPKRTYTFQRDKQGIVLNFYKCSLCPNMHPDGMQCQENAENHDKPLNE